MARVPTYDQQVTPNQLPGARVNVATPDGAFGIRQGQQLQQLGQGLDQLAVGMQRAQDEADTARVNDALNQLIETELDLTYGDNDGYTRLKGAQALDRPGGRPLSDEYTERLQSRSDEVLGSLGNARQRQLFQQRAQERLTQFRGNLMNYEGRENQDYQISVQQGSAALAAREISAFYNDPLRVADAAERLRGAVTTEGRLRGKAAAEIKVEGDLKVSAAHLGAINQMLGQNNPLGAERYLRQYKDDLVESDLLKARSAVDELASQAIGGIKADQVMQEYVQQTEPTDYDRFMNITGPVDMERVFGVTRATESNDRRFNDDGTPVTSPKGALYEYQVMPETAANPGFGIEPARDDSPEEFARVGRDYLRALVKRYDGRLAYVWAAYNAGPGRFEAAMEEAAKEGNPGAWLDKLPPETQDYVLKNERAYYNGGGRPDAPTPDELYARLAEDPDLQERPGALRKAQEELSRRLTMHQQGVKVRRDNAFMQAMQHIENGGRYDTIPAQVKYALDPAKWSGLRTYEERVRNGGRQHSDPLIYQRLASNPSRVRSMTEPEFYALRMDLSESDFKKFADMRGTNPSASNDPGNIDQTAVNRIVDSRLQSMGLDPKADSGSAAARVGAIRKTLNDVILREQITAGKKFNDAELSRLIDDEFLRTRTFKSESWISQFSGWLTGGGSELDGVRKRTLFGFTVDDIPSELRDRFEADLAADGFENPTDQQLLEAFYIGEILSR